ncbi:ABC transporter substrate-binding protein [Oribacterium sp. oral taxon 108]|uniref:ABC transporter substrate-binding protein n=1 Tax=Oribacterium sp. oral taxon 108 TaxID=712414 RepID=UPI00020DD72B|nr:ABC transporter substrate-binding protein [Oribacterium sp. oral taxon 108]EGL37631.1 receptor family ligand-binding protein [Oribacterium sp. oral taxon 108 str. F0425]
MKKQISFALATLMALSLVACGGNTKSSNETSGTASEKADASGKVWKIGAQGPLTGGAAVYGNAVVNGAEIAVNEINANGGINGYQIEYKKADDEHDQEKAINAYNSLKDWGMQFLVGPTTSAPAIAVGTESEPDNMFILSPSGSALEVTAPKNVFRVCFSDPAQGAKSAQYIGSHKLGTKIGIIYDSSDVYSTGVHDSFKEEAPKQGLEIVADEQFTADSNKDFSTQLQKMKDSGADLVFLPFYYTEAALVLTQANTMGYKPTFFGCDGMDGILNVENFDTKLAEGLMLLTPFAADAKDDLTVNFVKNYKEKYKDTPIQFAADAYDAVYAIKAAVEKANLTPDQSVSELGDAMEKAMTEISLDGLTGSGMKWDASGDVDKEPKAVIIKDGAYVSAE